MPDSEALRRLAADYRDRATTTANMAQRARHMSLAEHCEQLAAAMALRPRGLPARCAETVRRYAHTAKLMICR